jgi:dTDP-4-dehydrorhamnose reductase
MSHILVTGVSGLLGLNFALTVHGKTHRVTGVANTTPLQGVDFECLQAELTETGRVEALIDAIKPDVILHCAAMANLDACEANPALAAAVNSVLPGQIADAARRHGIQMVHISTDAVFDGAKGDYSEEDLPNPLSVYARTKWEAEKAVASANPQALIARVNFYGWSASGQRSLAEFFFYHLSAGQTVQGFTDVIFCPLEVTLLAETLLKMIIKGFSGLYHVVSSECLSKYDFGCRLAEQFGLNRELIQPASVLESGLAAARSPNLRLRTDKLVAALGHPLPGQASGLERLYTAYQAGYPQRLRSLAGM